MRRQAFLPEPEAVLHPGRNLTGLYLGKVLTVDPKAGLVRVELLDGAQPTAARMLVPAAAPGTGWVWLPQVGDLVVVGFLHGNNGMPVVMGALHGLSDALPSQQAGALTLHHPSGTTLVVAKDGTATLTQASGSFVTLTPNGGIELKDTTGGADVKLESTGLTISQGGAVAQITPAGTINLTPALGGVVNLGSSTNFVCVEGDATSPPIGTLATHTHTLINSQVKVTAG